MKVLFAPDWRQGAPYQRLLAEHLSRHGVEVDFPHGYRRLLPLYRLTRQQHSDLLHLHWPEPYIMGHGTLCDVFRHLRYPFDLHLAHLNQPLAYTAHNLWPHNTPRCLLLRHCLQSTLRRADLIFVHSKGALEELASTFDVDSSRCVVVPHGDLSPDLGQPIPQSEARSVLKIEHGRPIALLFGRAEPYKGVEEVIAWWNQHRPETQLAIVGSTSHETYKLALTRLVDSNPRISLHLRHQSQEELRLWLSAADVAVFNYRQIFTSGAASLARSWGLPILIPYRLKTVDLGEPSPYVHRFHSFEDDFAQALQASLAIRPSYAAAESWRDSISWESISAKTTAAYYKLVRG